MLTVDSLAEAMQHGTTMDRYTALLPAVNKCLVECGCTTVDRSAMWFGQIGEESGGLHWMEEIASGAAYEGRDDLGNNQPGDGVRFKGRGPIQVTGRHNYTVLSKWAFQKGYVPSATFFVDNPEQLASDRYGFLGVTWYWTTQQPRLNQFADEHNIEDASKAINAPAWIGNPNRHANGIADRTQRWRKALTMGDRILPSAAGLPVIVRPNFQEINLLGTRKISSQCQDRLGTIIDCLLVHTVEGDLDGLDLVAFMESMGERSYHYIATLDGTIVYDLVDTDYAAWSVGDANNRSINIVIGRSYSKWTRQEWIDKARNAIRNVAYILVQDNLKYSVNAQVCGPEPENTLVYLKNPPVFSDHKYVTTSLHWGNHTDVGPSTGRGDTGFPWDLLESDINYFLNGDSGEDDDVIDPALVKMIQEIHQETVTQKSPSRSFMATDGHQIDSPLGIEWNTDGNGWNLVVSLGYIAGEPFCVSVVESIAATGVFEGTYAKEENPWLAQLGQSYCKALVEFKAGVDSALTYLSGQKAKQDGA